MQRRLKRTARSSEHEKEIAALVESIKSKEKYEQGLYGDLHARLSANDRRELLAWTSVQYLKDEDAGIIASEVTEALQASAAIDSNIRAHQEDLEVARIENDEALKTLTNLTEQLRVEKQKFATASRRATKRLSGYTRLSFSQETEKAKSEIEALKAESDEAMAEAKFKLDEAKDKSEDARDRYEKLLEFHQSAIEKARTLRSIDQAEFTEKVYFTFIEVRRVDLERDFNKKKLDLNDSKDVRQERRRAR